MRHRGCALLHLPADQAFTTVELEALRRRGGAGAIRVFDRLLHGQGGSLAIDEEKAVGLDPGRELRLCFRHFLHHARHHCAILGRHGLPLVLHLFGRQLVRLVPSHRVRWVALQQLSRKAQGGFFELGHVVFGIQRCDQ